MSQDRYKRGAHTVLELKYHFVWKTKYGYHVLSRDLALATRQILRNTCAEKGITIIKGNVRSNHIHMMVELPSYMSVAKAAQYMKGKSSYRLQREFKDLKKRYWGQHLWARGYFCGTVGAITEETIKQYIDEQSDTPNNDQEGFKVWDENSSDLSSDSF